MVSKKARNDLRFKRRQEKRNNPQESKIKNFVRKKFTYPIRKALLQKQKSEDADEECVLKFAHINVNGLDHESAWYLQQLFEARKYDVSK